MADARTVTVGSPLPALAETTPAEAAAPGASAPTAASSSAARALPPAPPGRYRIGLERGRGGLGRVLAAEDAHLDRPVAVKELLRVGPEERARFAREARLTARLQHPAIVPVYDAGEWPGGEPFYAMKLVDGRPLAEILADTDSLETRLALVPKVLAVAEAVAYAHSRRVIHRDLKPANVLVGGFGEVVVIDWGLARDLGEPDDLPPGTVAGTPAYMAPEQARGEVVDARADVYALGALLHHVLAGKPPFMGDPDRVLTAVRRGPPPALEAVAPGVPRDLAAVVRKAMARACEERYPDAGGLADDLSRFLTGQLVGAREYSRGALVSRWLRRHRAPVAVAAVLLTALALVGAVAAWRVVRERNVARARSAQLTLAQARAALERDPTEAVAWLETYPESGAEPGEWRRLAADAASRGVARAVLDGGGEVVQDVVLVPGRGLVATAGGDAVRLWEARRGALVDTLPLAGARRLAVSPDGRALAVASESGQVRLMPLDGGAPRALPGHDRWVNALAFSPDGGALLSAGADGEVHVVGLASGVVERHTGHAEIVAGAAWTGDGRVLSAGLDGTVREWPGGRVLVRVAAPGAAFAATADGARIAVGDGDTVLLWEASTGAARPLGRHVGAVTALAFSLDGATLASGGEDGVVTLWPVAGGAERRLRGHEKTVWSLAFGMDGTLASGDAEGDLRVWRGDDAWQLRGHGRGVARLAFSPDGGLLVSASDDGSARLWPVPAPRRFLRGAVEDVFRVSFTADGRHLAAVGRDGAARFWDLETRRGEELGRHKLAAYGLALLPDGRVATSSWDGSVAVWRPGGAGAAASFAHGAQVWGLAASPDGTRLATAGADGVVRVWDLASGASRVVARHGGESFDVVFSPDGTRVASVGADNLIRVAAVDGGGGAGGEVVLAGHEATPAVVLFAADGRTLYSAGHDGTVRVWDLAGGEPRVLRGHTGQVRALALSPDGTRLASGGQDRSVRVWDLGGDGGGARVTVLDGHGDVVRGLAFSPDGAILASAGWDGTVRLWRLDDGALAVLRGHAGRVHRVAFSRDGRWLASAAQDGAVGLWALDEVVWVPRDRRAVRAWLAALTSATATLSPRSR